jgi:hypothetical protein
MWQGYLIAAAAGLFAANGIPHFTRGITGRRHQTPWRNPASAAENVVWGGLNFLAAAWLGVWATTFGPDPGWALTAAIVAGTLFGVLLAAWWARAVES